MSLSTPIEFPFIDLQSENLGKIRKPFAIASLMNGEKHVQDIFLVDSGADVTLIPKSFGIKLGLKPPLKKDIKFLGGIAGGVPVAHCSMDMTIGKIRFLCRVAWAQVEDVPPVLGRVDVFDKFDIEFKQRDRKILFKPK